MRIQTLALGEIEYTDNEVITFPQGIPGFEEYTRFIIIGRGEAFSYLQSLEEERLHFVILNPFDLFQAYEFELHQSDQDELNIQSEEGIEVWSIVTLGEKPEQYTLNLMGPIVVNKVSRLGKQIVLHQSPYGTKHSLVELIAQSKEGE
ncbi:MULTISPECIES: flagellar assembly protein FliW [Paenibacillus]|uniref:flagellar assembly protein FliW n=1 Tax=Paenibacillus TaxID=44249 RepID=UPI0022B87017|nr:flagellar assembly protein FliW [Paenibacillus caseinilyticus]MCZ8523309.1 flagellar assembly protein FliW [Paenibacillus caseinilyticus]